jgi:PIN domain nuclease of toxin-antitoxin system
LKLLLDSCTFLWMVGSPDNLSPKARKLLSSATQDVCFSVVSRWELLVKQSLGGLTLPGDPAGYFDDATERFCLLDLPLQSEDVAQITRLPAIHRDPFDRMLICQAIAQGLTLVTPDPLIHQYPVSVAW